MAAVLRLSLEHAESDAQTQQPQQTQQAPQAQRVDWSKFALRLYNRFAREREISGVAIANHILQQPAFFLPLGEQRKVHINLFWVRFEVSRIACLSQVAELPEGLNETSQHQYSAFTTTRSQPTTIYDNFRHRGPELADMCFYEYCCQVQVVKLQHSRSSDIRFNKEYPNYDTLCQRVARHHKDLITPSIYGKISDLENQQDAITGEYQNTGPIWNDHCQVLLGLFIPWDQLPGLFEEHCIDDTNPSDACSSIWEIIKDLQPPHIQRLASNVSLLRKSKEDAEADRLAREQELLDFDDIAWENMADEGGDTEMVPYQPRVMSKSDLFYAYRVIRAKWEAQSISPDRNQPLELLAESLVALPTSLLRTDDSLSYFEERVRNMWKLELKSLLKSRSNEQEPDSAHGHGLRDQAEDAAYEPNVVTATDCGMDIQHIRLSLGPSPSIDDVFGYITVAFTPNEKQGLIIKNVLKAILGLDTSQIGTVTESSQQFLLYVGGCGGTGKTQIINAILFGMELLGIQDRACVTASTGTAAAHIRGQTVHSAVGITNQGKGSISPTKLSTLQNLLRGTLLFIVDEISMVSTKLLGQVDQNCAKVFELPTSGSAVFGGVPVVLVFGDFFQFPPVGGDPLWTSKPVLSFPDLERDGWNTWRRFNQVIILTECLRQKDDPVYQGLLQRARDVTMTQDDVDLLNTCTIAQRQARGETLPELSITTRNKLRHELNRMHVIDFARTHDQKVYVFAATHKPLARKAQSKQGQRLFGNLTDIPFSRMLELDDGNPLKGSGLLLYTKGMPVMCLGNVSTRSGVVNGMCGVATHVVPDPAGK